MLKKYSSLPYPPARWRSDPFEELTTGSGRLDVLLPTDDSARTDQSGSQPLAEDDSRAGFPIALDKEFAPPHADPPTQQEQLVAPPSAIKLNSASQDVADLSGSPSQQDSAVPVAADEQTETALRASEVDSAPGNSLPVVQSNPASQPSLFYSATPVPLTVVPLSPNSTLDADSFRSSTEEYQTDQDQMPQNPPSNDTSVAAGSSTSPEPIAENSPNVVDASSPAAIDSPPVEPNQQPSNSPLLDEAQTASIESQPSTSSTTSELKQQSSAIQSQTQQPVTPPVADSAVSDSLYWLLLFWLLLLVPLIVGVVVWQWLARRKKRHGRHRLRSTDEQARGEFKKSTRLSTPLAASTANSKQYNDDLVDAETSSISISQTSQPIIDSEFEESKMATDKPFDDEAEELNFDFADEAGPTIAHSNAMEPQAELLEDSANVSEIMNLDAFDFGDDNPDDDSQLFGESKEERFDHPEQTPSMLAPSADSVGESNNAFLQSPHEISPSNIEAATAAEKTDRGFISRIGSLFGKKKPFAPAKDQSPLDITQTEDVVRLTSVPIENTIDDLPESIGPIHVSITKDIESAITCDEVDLNFDDIPTDDDEFKGRFNSSVDGFGDDELDLQEPETRVEFQPASIARPLGMVGDWIENAPASSHESQPSELLAELETLRAERSTLHQSLQASQQELAAFTQQQQQQLDELNLEQQQQRAERQQFEADYQLAEQQRLLEQRELQQRLDAALQEKQSLAGQLLDLQTLQTELTNALSENQGLIDQKSLIDQQLAERLQRENASQLAEQQRLLEQRELQQRLDSALQEKQSLAGQLTDLQTLQTELTNALSENKTLLHQQNLIDQQRVEHQRQEAARQLAEQQQLVEQRELQQRLDSALQERQSLAGQLTDLQTLRTELTNALSENQSLINQKILVDQQLAERLQQENAHQLAEQQRLLEQRELQQRLDSALLEKQTMAEQLSGLHSLQTQLADALAEKQMFLAQLADRDQQLIDERSKIDEVSLPAMADAAQPDKAAIDQATKQKFTKLYRAYERERKLRKQSEQFLVDAEEQRDQLRAALQSAKREIADQPPSVIRNSTTAENSGAVPAASTPRPKTINLEDLTQITGIGKAIRAKLHSVGIRNIQQIAAWSDEDVARVDQQLSLKSKIQKDQWIEQAQTLVEKLSTEENFN